MSILQGARAGLCPPPGVCTENGSGLIGNRDGRSGQTECWGGAEGGGQSAGRRRGKAQGCTGDREGVGTLEEHCGKLRGRERSSAPLYCMDEVVAGTQAHWSGPKPLQESQVTKKLLLLCLI